MRRAPDRSASGFLCTLIGFALITASAPAAGSTPTPVGGEILITGGNGEIGVPDVGLDGNGDAVVVWPRFTSIFFPPFPEEQWQLQFRSVDALGALGSTTLIESPVTQAPPQLQVDVADDGSFFVVYEPFDAFAMSLETKRARYDASHAVIPPVGFLSSANDYYARTARMPNGDLFVVWTSFDFAGDFSDAVIKARRFEADGTPIGAPFRVNTTVSGNQFIPAIAVDSGGNVIVAWYNFFDESDLFVNGQRYDASGNPVGSELVLAVEPAYPNNQFFEDDVGANRIQIAYRPGGGFIVAWDRVIPPNGTDFSGRAVRAARFAADGSPIGSDFQVNTTTAGDQTANAVVTNSDGSFVVLYTSAASPGSDSSGTAILGQRFDELGRPAGAEFQVNTETLDDQDFAAAAGDAAGEFVVAWRSGSIPNSTIRLQRFSLPTLPPKLPALGPPWLPFLTALLAAAGVYRLAPRA